MTSNALLLTLDQLWFAVLSHYFLLVQWIATVCFFLAMLYVLVVAAVKRYGERAAPHSFTSSYAHIAFPHAHSAIANEWGVSVLKPLCGSEPRLYENLQTFCMQTMAERTQLVFGVASADDPAVYIVRKLQKAYPDQEMQLVVDKTVHGTNLKVSNLINMQTYIRHDVVVIADSDIAVQPDYLEKVIAPLHNAENGLVTCLYKGRSAGGIWARLGALFIDAWFAPAVSIAHAGGSRRFGFGATLALRRETLTQIGGLRVLKDQLADDYWLAEHTRILGLKTVLSTVVVVTDVTETTFEALWLREMRWLKTIRSLNRMGFAFLFVTFTTPWILVGLWLMYGWHVIDAERGNAMASGSAAGWVAAADNGHATISLCIALATVVGAVARIALHFQSTWEKGCFWRDLALVPMRELLLAVQWLMATMGQSVNWRGEWMAVSCPKLKPRSARKLTPKSTPKLTPKPVEMRHTISGGEQSGG